jgi:hypothetical protein
MISGFWESGQPLAEIHHDIAGTLGVYGRNKAVKNFHSTGYGSF